jgi:RNA polymerase sigma-70 factor (ECF subfamily)
MPERAAVSERSRGPTADSVAVYAEFQRRLRAFISRRVRNSADVEDILQDTFLRIHRHLAQVRAPERLSAWVFQVARSAMIDHHRRRRPQEVPREDHEASTAAAAPPVPGSPSELEELAACLAPMIESLPALDREAVDLSEIRGLTQREASVRAGVTLSGMKSRVQRARRKLKAMLLDCCRVELDRRGGVVAHEAREGRCEPCGPRLSSRSGRGDPTGVRRCRG